MRAVHLLLISVLLSTSAAHEAQATGPTGRYGLSAAACRSNDIFATISDNAVTLPVYSCTGVRFDPAGGAGDSAHFKAIARSCIAEGQVQPSAQVFRVIQTQGTAQFFWSDGTRSSKLVRCRERGRR